ncbi:MAG: hypothetical protein ABIH72_00125 [archaeon]
MQIVGFNFQKISGERTNPSKGKIEIKTNIDVKKVTSEKIEALDNKEIIRFDFEYAIGYEPKIANISFEGYVLVVFDNQKTKDIIKKWKNKKIGDELRIPLFNFIFSKCNIKALQLEEEFSLPPHIPMPKLGPPKDQNREYIK